MHAQDIDGQFARFNEGLLDIIHDPRDFADLILYCSIRQLVSGGQPQYIQGQC